jgi:hypothetical protein
VSRQAEVQVHGICTGTHTLVECSACGPVAVTDAPLTQAVTEHLLDHQLDNERSNR